MHVGRVSTTVVVGGDGAVVLQERVHEPEFDVLDVGGLEVVHVEFPHHSAPSFVWLQQMSVSIERRVEVVGSAFVGIVCQVEDAECGGVLVVDAFVGIKFRNGHFPDIGAGELLEVALDVSRCKAAAASCEERVDVVPSKQCTVVTVANIVRELALCKHGWRAADGPFRRSGDVDFGLRVLEVVNVRCVALRSFVGASDEVCELCRKIDA